MEIKDYKLNEIKPYEKNPRRNDEAVKYVAKSIEEFGFKVPIVIDENNIIVCGHTRYKAAKKLKLTTVPCIMADDLTEEQIKAFRLADNRVGEIAEWDFDLLDEELQDLIDFDMEAFGFEGLLEDEEESEVEEDDFDIDEEYNEDEPAISQYGEIYQLGRHRLMCGDSTKAEDVEKLMDGKQADLVITDPPYNVDYSSKNEILNKAGKGNCIQRDIENDSMSAEEFKTFLTKVFSNMKDALKPGGSFYIWHADMETYNFRGALKESGLTIRQCLIWNKNVFVIGMADYQWKHEPCMYGWKEGAAHYFVDDRSQTTVIEDKKQDFKKMKKEDLVKLLEDIYSDKVSTTIINEKKPSISDLHPTMKPIKLFARHIKNSSKQKENVLDLFGGSGTTIMACEQLNRNAFVMEYDPRYVDAIIKRWEQFTGQKAEKIA